jgi:hypothetical protein
MKLNKDDALKAIAFIFYGKNPDENISSVFISEMTRTGITPRREGSVIVSSDIRTTEHKTPFADPERVIGFRAPRSTRVSAWSFSRRVYFPCAPHSHNAAFPKIIPCSSLTLPFAIYPHTSSEARLRSAEHHRQAVGMDE